MPETAGPGQMLRARYQLNRTNSGIKKDLLHSVVTVPVYGEDGDRVLYIEIGGEGLCAAGFAPNHSAAMPTTSATGDYLHHTTKGAANPPTVATNRPQKPMRTSTAGKADRE